MQPISYYLLIGFYVLKKTIQNQEIIQLLKTHYGIDIYEAQPMQGGADMNAYAYKADSKSKKISCTA